MVEDAGLATIGLHWLLAKTEGFYLTSPDPEVRRRTVDYLITLAEATRDLGGSLMVLGSPKQRDLLPGVSHDQALGYALEIFRRVMTAIGALGVDLCLEPLAPFETNFLNTCSQARALIDEVDHPHFKSDPPGGCSLARPPSCCVTRPRAWSRTSILNRFASLLAGG